VTYLLDTNVLSEARRPKGNRGVKEWFAAAPPDALFVSVLVLGEIRSGVDKLAKRDAARAAIYEAWLEELCDVYADRLLPVTADVAQIWGRINATTSVPVVDGLIAATARVHGLTVVTRNVTDLERAGVQVVNPFT
jgi:toxin FitB